MPRSHNSCSASTPCRVDWRPSPLALACLLLLALGAAVALLMSDFPRIVAWPLAIAALARGAWLARREQRKLPAQLAWPGNGPALLDGQPLQQPSLHLRGPCVFLHWREGRRLRALVWWPDTLDQAQRRELRLAAGGADTSRLPPSMAT